MAGDAPQLCDEFPTKIYTPPLPLLFIMHVKSFTVKVKNPKVEMSNVVAGKHNTWH